MLVYLVNQFDELTVIRMAGSIDDIEVDGVRELQPDDMWFGQRAKDLKPGIYDEHGKPVDDVDELPARR